MPNRIRLNGDRKPKQDAQARAFETEPERKPVAQPNPDATEESTRQPLSDEARERLGQRVTACGTALSYAVCEYATEIQASEWASYDDGETERFIKCFAPMVRDLLTACQEEYGDASEGAWRLIERNVCNLIKRACKDTYPLPPTWPWPPSELFNNSHFQDALNVLIKGEAGNLRRKSGKETPDSDKLTETLWKKKAQFTQERQPLSGTASSARARKPVRRNPKYQAIDEELRKIAEMRPGNHEEVFRALDGRVPPPNAEPFKTHGGWLIGFRHDGTRARAWLSKAWSRLNLPAFCRGPKGPNK
jgi:hypothetical protein